MGVIVTVFPKVYLVNNRDKDMVSEKKKTFMPSSQKIIYAGPPKALAHEGLRKDAQ